MSIRKDRRSPHRTSTFGLPPLAHPPPPLLPSPAGKKKETVRKFILQCDTPCPPVLYSNQILSKNWKRPSSCEAHKILQALLFVRAIRLLDVIHSPIKYYQKKKELSFLHATHLLDVIHIPIKYYKNIS